MDRALRDCLDALHDGRALQDVLRRHPGRRDEMIAMLQLSVDLQQLQAPAPDPAFRLRARNRMLASARRGRSLSRLPVTYARRLRPVLYGVAGAAAAVAIVAGGASAAAQTVPGEPLYPLKTAVEGIELRLTLDPTASAHLRLEFAQRRLAEAQRLASIGRVPEAVQMVDLYAATLSADAGDQASAAGQAAADQELQRLAGSLNASGQRQAAVSIERAKAHLDQAMASRQSRPTGPSQATGPAKPAAGRPGAATGAKAR